MKKLFGISTVLIVALGLMACNDDEPTVNVDFYYRTIDSVDIGAINRPNEITEIKTYYTRVNSCEDFFDYDYLAIDTNRQVRLITGRVEGDNCQEISEADYGVLKFRPRSSGVYTFRFWNGYDDEGNPKFIVKQIIIE